MIKKTCKYCGAEFEAQRNSAKFCSQKCKKAHKRNQPKPTKKICPVCGTEFVGNSNKLYCSRECYLINRKINIRENHNPKNNPKYYGKYTYQYLPNRRQTECMNLNGENYTTMITNVRKRANGHSELTGKKSDKLIAHHLNGYHWYVSGRCDPSNIIMLTENEHKHFHHIYGNKNNTIDQFMEFMELYP